VALDLDQLRRRVRADPGSHYFLGLADALLRAGEGAEALAVLEAGLAVHPGHLAASVAKARCLVALGRRLDAWATLEPVLRRDPAHLVAANLAVEIWLAEGAVGRARAALERYAPLGSADPDLRRLESRLADLEGAIAGEGGGAGTWGGAGDDEPCESARAGDPRARDPVEDGDPIVTVTLGNLYLAQGHRAEAERIFRRILRDDPDHAAARQALARALGAAKTPGAGRQDI
jgi:predicted Zn-dependent protease